MEDSLPKGTTKGQAKDELRAIEELIRSGVYLPTKRIPLFAQVAKDWLEQKQANVRESTYKMYQGHLNGHFTKINDLKINRITTARVEKFITGKQCQGMNLTTLRKIIVTFNQVMQYAVRHKYIDHNPVRDAMRPRGQGSEEKSFIRVLSTSEINALLETEKDHKFRNFFMLAIMSGARQGELIGLKWTDIDWFNNQIHIQRTFNHGKWYKPKTKTSNRKIDLGPATMLALRKWQAACPPGKNNLVFPNQKGNPIDGCNILQRRFYPLLTKAGISKVRFHDLRHTYASLLIEQGENIKYIQTQLGHATPTITLNVYAHLINPVNQESAKRLEKIIFEKSGSRMVAEAKKGVRGKPLTP